VELSALNATVDFFIVIGVAALNAVRLIIRESNQLNSQILVNELPFF
jgi:hypothetical protein